MAEAFQTSFIPKKSFDVGAPKRTRRTGLLFSIAVLVTVLSLAFAVGVFAYEKFLESSIENKREALQRAREAFEPELIRELSHLDTKIQTAETLLGSHIAVSGIFDILEDATLETVQFTNFSYGIEPEGVRVSMSGVARSFSSVALQSDEFLKSRLISQPVFGDLKLDERGNVTFSAQALIDAAAVSYEGRMQDGASASFDIEGAVAGESTSVETVVVEGAAESEL